MYCANCKPDAVTTEKHAEYNVIESIANDA